MTQIRLLPFGFIVFASMIKTSLSELKYMQQTYKADSILLTAKKKHEKGWGSLEILIGQNQIY